MGPEMVVMATNTRQIISITTANFKLRHCCFNIVNAGKQTVV